MSIYTKKGDQGTTVLLGGKRRVRKDSQRIIAYGTVDELQSQLGFVESLMKQRAPARNAFPPTSVKLRRDAGGEIKRIQQDLFEIEAELSTPGSRKPPVCLSERRVKELEKLIDELEGKLPVLANFIFPGGSPGGAALHVARTICRRAEREVVKLARRENVNENVIKYLNRLSDALFMLAREANRLEGNPEEIWKIKDRE